MDQMDANARYEMGRRNVVFEYEAEGEPRAAAITEAALEKISGADVPPGEGQHVLVYQAHWLAIHGCAAALHGQGRRPVVVRADDL